jgi:hypothetical protein
MTKKQLSFLVNLQRQTFNKGNQVKYICNDPDCQAECEIELLTPLYENERPEYCPCCGVPKLVSADKLDPERNVE